MTHLRANPWSVVLVLCLGFFMILLDTTIVNIAIPSMVDALNAPLDEILWVVNAYILVYAVLLITAGRLGDLYGQRTLFAAGLALFTLASALCGLAQETPQLILARVLQGVGGALLTPQTLALLTTIIPPERRGAAFGVWGAVGGVAAVAGPTLGGLIVASIGWRWIFYVNLPIGALALAGTYLLVPDIRPGRQHRLDIVGVALASLGLLGVTFGLIEGERFHWGPIWGAVTIPMVIAAGVLLLVAFVLWERTQREPLIPLALYRDRNYLLMNGAVAAMAFAMLGLFLPITIYLQSALGLSALQAGLTVAPMSLVSMVVAPLSGRLADRVGGKYILLGGLTLFAAGMGLVTLLATPTTSATTFVAPLMLAGLGLGCVFAPLTTVAMRNIQPPMAGAASGVLNTTRQVGGVIGSAVVGAVLQAQLAGALRSEGAAAAQALPPAVRQPFVAAVEAASRGGLEVGRAQTARAPLLLDLPPELVPQVQQLFHQVFTNAFVAAMHGTLMVPIAVLLLAALSCLAIESPPPAAARPAGTGRAAMGASPGEAAPRR